MNIEFFRPDKETLFIQVDGKIIGTLVITEDMFIVHILNGNDNLLCTFHCVRDVSNFILNYMEGFEND